MEPTSPENPEKSLERRIAVVCPECGQRYKIAARMLGKRLLCKKCRCQWRASRPRTGAPSAAGQLEEPSDSGQVDLFEELPRATGSGSIAIDMSWAGRRIGRYRARSLLGYGGMGAVWRAHDDALRRDVALKILNQKKGQQPGGLNLELFRQEAWAIAKLSHPAVVSIYEVAEDRGHIFLSLELMEGGTLQERVEQNGPIEPRKLFEMMAGPARGLALAHRRDVVHRDIKPSNLMFDDHGHLKLMDFGLADMREEKVSEKLRGKAVGSLGWIAPETARGEGTTMHSDIYSFGLVMMYALTGKPIINAKSRSEIIALHRNPPEPDFNKIAGLTQKAQRVLRKCLLVEPSARFSTADELAAALEACAEEDPTAKRRQRKSHVTLAVAAGVIGAIVGIGLTMDYLLDLMQRQDQLRQPADISPANRAPFEGATPSATETEQSTGIELDSARMPASPSNTAGLNLPWPDSLDEAELTFIGSTEDRIFHLPSGRCGARQILLSNLVRFAATEEARKAGRQACPTCLPHSKRPGGAIKPPER